MIRARRIGSSFRRPRLHRYPHPARSRPARKLRSAVLESTYGDRTHPSRKNRIETLRRLLHKALADKGIVYIPAFALGRTQELLYELDRIGSMCRCLSIRPWGLKSRLFIHAWKFFGTRRPGISRQNGDHPFDFKGLYAIRKYQDHHRLLTIPGPAIIIAGSGMCTGGRIVDHLNRA
jgi:metallo-beta-lactamase family protein